MLVIASWMVVNGNKLDTKEKIFNSQYASNDAKNHELLPEDN